MSQTELKDKADKVFNNEQTENMKRYQKLLDRIVENSKSQMVANEKDEESSLVDDSEKKALATVMEKAETPEQEQELLTMADPRNGRDYFDTRYQSWARDNTRTYTNLASVRSKVSYWIGTTLFANPADKDLPDYVWYVAKDRAQVFNGHFDPKNYSKNDKNILYTNRRIYELRDELQKRIAFWFLIFGIALGGFSWTATKVHNGYTYVANKIAAGGDKDKFKEQQLESLKADALALVEERKTGKINDDQFLERKKELVAREKAINAQ